MVLIVHNAQSIMLIVWRGKKIQHWSTLVSLALGHSAFYRWICTFPAKCIISNKTILKVKNVFATEIDLFQLTILFLYACFINIYLEINFLIKY